MTNKAHLTAIKRNRLSAPMAYLNKSVFLGGQLDYGCGRGEDADIIGMKKYDPHYFPNEDVLRPRYTYVTCNYVLNVVDAVEGSKILSSIIDILTPNGVAYISVRRDVKQDGLTKKGTYQRNVILNLPVVHEKKGSFCIYRLDKNNVK